jgi:hypothetical protein
MVWVCDYSVPVYDGFFDFGRLITMAVEDYEK